MPTSFLLHPHSGERIGWSQEPPQAQPKLQPAARSPLASPAASVMGTSVGRETKPPCTYRGFGVQAIALGAGAEGGAQGCAILTTYETETEGSM